MQHLLRKAGVASRGPRRGTMRRKGGRGGTCRPLLARPVGLDAGRRRQRRGASLRGRRRGRYSRTPRGVARYCGGHGRIPLGRGPATGCDCQGCRDPRFVAALGARRARPLEGCAAASFAKPVGMVAVAVCRRSTWQAQAPITAVRVAVPPASNGWPVFSGAAPRRDGRAARGQILPGRGPATGWHRQCRRASRVAAGVSLARPLGGRTAAPCVKGAGVVTNTACRWRVLSAQPPSAAASVVAPSWVQAPRRGVTR